MRKSPVFPNSLLEGEKQLLANAAYKKATRSFLLMALLARRSFLQQSLAAGAACSAELLLGRHLPAQTPSSNAAGPVRLYLDTKRTIASIARNIFGSFLDHLGLGNNITSAACAL